MVVVSPPATIDDCGRAGRMAEDEVVSEHIEELTEIKDIMDVDQNDAAMPQDEEHEDVFGDADDATGERGTAPPENAQEESVHLKTVSKTKLPGSNSLLVDLGSKINAMGKQTEK